MSMQLFGTLSGRSLLNLLEHLKPDFIADKKYHISVVEHDDAEPCPIEFDDASVTRVSVSYAEPAPKAAE